MMVLILCYSFDGCLHNLTINSGAVGLQEATPSNLGNDPSSALSGCPREESCIPSPCQHGGDCLSNWYNYTCQCTEDYTGQDCSQGNHITMIKLALCKLEKKSLSLLHFFGHRYHFII